MRGASITRAAVAAALLLMAVPVRADEASFALRARWILPDGRSEAIENGVVVVRDGRIVAIGADVEPPVDLPLLEERDAWIMPGLVAAASGLGGAHRGDESVAAGYRAVDAFDRYGDFRQALLSGVTTAHVGPGAHRLVSGQGAVVKLGGSPQSRALRERADLAVQLGDPSDSPPLRTRIPFPASSDVAIEPPEIQAPSSRIDRVQRFLESVRGSAPADPIEAFHHAELLDAMRDRLPLRIHADRATDLVGARRLLATLDRGGYLVGGADALAARDALAGAGLVYQPRSSLRAPAADLGSRPDPLETRFEDLARIVTTVDTLALAPARGDTLADMRLAAIAAHGAGLSRADALDAISRNAATILGVSDRVGRLAPGLDADLVVFSGDPLDPRSQVLRVAVDGRWVAGPPTDAIVVRAGTIWVSQERVVRDGEMLVRDGRVVAVGASVPHPPFSRVVDAGPDGFVTPGFIDARNHLELHGDRGAASADVDLSRLVGVSGLEHERVARHGITTTIVAPYATASRGSRLLAVKTVGTSRDGRVIRSTAGVAFRVSSNKDPLEVKNDIKAVLDRGKAYLEKWRKYDKELAEYEARMKRGEKIDAKRNGDEETGTEAVESDPITGIWEGTASGGPIDGEVSGKIALRLDGSSVEGRVIEPEPPVEHRILLEFDGTALVGRVEVDTGGMGEPRIEAQLTGEDTMTGTVSLATISVNFEARRIEKKDVEFKVVTRKRRDRSGRPNPPKVDEALEPIRALLEKKIPAVVRVRRPMQIEGILDLFEKDFDLPLVLFEADAAEHHAERLARRGVGVMLSHPLVGQRDNREHNQGAELAIAGVPIAFQSGAADGARKLPLAIAHAVGRGLDADAALAALTTQAARLFKIEHRVGSLEPGRDGDFAIFKGHPFRSGAHALRVFINGQEVPRR